MATWADDYWSQMGYDPITSPGFPPYIIDTSMLAQQPGDSSMLGQDDYNYFYEGEETQLTDLIDYSYQDYSVPEYYGTDYSDPYQYMTEDTLLQESESTLYDALANIQYNDTLSYSDVDSLNASLLATVQSQGYDISNQTVKNAVSSAVNSAIQGAGFSLGGKQGEAATKTSSVSPQDIQTMVKQALINAGLTSSSGSSGISPALIIAGAIGFFLLTRKK